MEAKGKDMPYEDLDKQEAEAARKLYRKAEAIKQSQEHILYQGYSTFKKNIPSTIQTNPEYSIGKALRKPLILENGTPGPIYSQENRSNMIFSSMPKWRIGTSHRPPLSSCEHYDYYDRKYNEVDELGSLPKQWNHIKGGATNLEPKNTCVLFEKMPGPGRYDPNFKSTLKKTPSCSIGLRLNMVNLINCTGTNNNVAPGTYYPDHLKSLSQHYQEPEVSFPKAKRQPLGKNLWTKNESYYLYSSIGEQIISQKPTLPSESFGLETRNSRNKCGMFKSTMDRSPTSIRIQLPKF